MDRDEQLNLPEFTVAVSRLVTKSVAHSKGKGALSATEKLFLDAVKIHRSELGKVVDNQGYYFKRLVPLVYFCLVVISIYARYFDSSALINEASSAFFGPGAWHVRCALGAAAFSTVVAGQQALNHLSRAVDSSAPLVVTIVCLCPVYAWASAIKLLLPGQVFGLHRHVLDAAKEVYEAVVLNDLLKLMYHSAGIKAGKPVPLAMRHRHVHFGPPIQWLWPQAHFDEDLVATLEQWTLQYVVLQPLLAALHLAIHHLKLPELIGDNDGVVGVAVERAAMFVYLVSTTLSLSALIGFYHTFEAELESAMIKRKLLLVKGVVGLCFWQSLASASISQHLSLSGLSDASQVNDLLVATELGVLGSLAFAVVFPAPKVPAAKRLKFE